MSEPESFAARWSRLKRKADPEKGEPVRETRPQAQPADDAGASLRKAARAESKDAEPAFDLTKLPPIDSITSATDMRAFLEAGVPAELAKAALRRAWAADPAIRDFMCLAENQWDFTDPTAIAGFGPLEVTDDVRDLVNRAMGKLAETPEPPEPVETAGPLPAQGDDAGRSAMLSSQEASSTQVAGMPGTNDKVPPADSEVDGREKTVSAAPQHGGERAEHGVTPNRRGHGRALPR